MFEAFIISIAECSPYSTYLQLPKLALCIEEEIFKRVWRSRRNQSPKPYDDKHHMNIRESRFAFVWTVWRSESGQNLNSAPEIWNNILWNLFSRHLHTFLSWRWIYSKSSFRRQIYDTILWRYSVTITSWYWGDPVLKPSFTINMPIFLYFDILLRHMPFTVWLPAILFSESNGRTKYAELLFRCSSVFLRTQLGVWPIKYTYSVERANTSKTFSNLEIRFL